MIEIPTNKGANSYKVKVAKITEYAVILMGNFQHTKPSSWIKIIYALMLYHNSLTSIHRNFIAFQLPV